VSDGDKIRKLRAQLSYEKNAAQRREIMTGLLAQIEVGWSELFELIATNQSPERMLLLLAELDEIIETRQAQLAKKAKRKSA
jgi:hypothetical protein